MSNTRTGGMKRTSYLDRTWLDHWTVLALVPVKPPDIAELRAKLVSFMEADHSHPLCCTLEDDGRLWMPVDAAERQAHVERVIVSGGKIDSDDPFTYLVDNQPPADSTDPYKVIVGPDSITCYFAHATGDAAVFSPFSVLMALGDVEGLKPLRANAGTAVATKIFIRELRAHWRDWWQHTRSNKAHTEPLGSTLATPPGQPTKTTAAVGFTLSPEEFKEFKVWRKASCGDVSSTALMASAAYRALVEQGVPVNRAGFYTLVDLRRHLPKNQALLPGNLVKSAFVPADMDRPLDVAKGLKRLVDSARAVPALLAGALSIGLRRTHPPASAGGPVTMTFNSLVRNPGVEHIPWTDPTQARYITMSYPAGAESISVAAAAVEGQVMFSASFDPGVIDQASVQRALEMLRDMPSLLTPRFLEPGEPSLDETPAEWVAASTRSQS